MKYIFYNDKYLSKIGLGVSRYGTLVNKEQSYLLLDTFVQNGGTVVDTARNYYEWVENGRGKSEELLGQWMEERKNRESMVVSTKGGVRNSGKVFTADLSCKNLRTEMAESLDALRTDYVDIYLLHRDEPDRMVEEIVDSVQELLPFVKNQLIGVSNWSVERLKKANSYALSHGLTPFKVVQTWWSIASYTSSMWDDPTTTWMSAELYQHCLENNILAMGYTSQAKGFFQKAISSGLSSIDPFLKKRILTENNLRKLDHMNKYCLENNVAPTAVVSAYITSNPLSGLALISTSQIEHLVEILNCSDYILPMDEINWYDSLDMAY